MLQTPPTFKLSIRHIFSVLGRRCLLGLVIVTMSLPVLEAQWLSHDIKTIAADTVILEEYLMWINSLSTRNADSAQQLAVALRPAIHLADTTYLFPGKYYTIVGMMHQSGARPDSAMQYFEQAYTMFDNINYKYGMAIVLSALKQIAQDRGDFENATRYAFASLELRREYLDREVLPGNSLDSSQFAVANVEVANLLHLRDLDEEAKPYAEAAIDLLSRIGLPNERAIAHSTYAQILISLERGLDAKQHADLSLQYARESKQIDVIASSLLLSADLDRIAGREQLARDKLQQAFTLAETSGLLGTHYGSTESFGDLSLSIGEGSAAVTAYRNVLQSSHLTGYRTSRLRAYNGLSKAYELTGRLDSALYFANLSAALTDSLSSDAATKSMLELQTVYETETKDREIARQNELAVAAAKRTRLITAALVTSVFSVLLIGVLALKLRKRTREREVLVHEVHHRVKNNLQVLSSLLYLQSRHVDDAAALAAIQESQHRVEAMGLIHQRLYSRDRLTEVRMDGYLEELADTLRDAFGRSTISLKMDVDAVDLPAQLAIDIGLIANELISNAFKYAFNANDEHGTVRIALKREHANRYRFEISDTGAGLKSSEQQYSGASGFGTQLVAMLTQKLGTKLETNAGKEGYRAWFSFAA